MRTDTDDEESPTRSKLEDGLGPEATAAALRLRDRAGFQGSGERGLYMCHTFCELGFTPLERGLRDIREFLVANPAEVVVVINQDGISPEDFAAAVEEAGLLDLVYRGPVAPRFETLREMIDDDERLVMLAEEDAGDVPWYHVAYDAAMNETPFQFPSAKALTDRSRLARSCEPNRGPERAPLLLMNHWVSTDPAPRPSDAAKVNRYDALLARARECARVRGKTPNLLAINFFREGDAFAVADTLNGVSRDG